MALGSYATFIASMLGLREQRLKEEQLKQAERMAQQEQMSKMMQGMGQQFGSMAEQMGQNRMANQLMTEQYGAPPRAGAVNTPWSNEMAAGKPGFYQGGMPELKMRMAMAEDQSQADYRNAMINRMGENLKFQKSKWLVDQAQAAGKNESVEQRSAFDDSLAYIKKRDAIMDALGNAETPEQYKSSMDSLNALEAAGAKRGLKVAPIDRKVIAPFMTADERTALETQQTAVSEARTALEEAQKAPPGLIDKARSFFGLGTGSGALGLPGIPTQQEGAIKTATQLYEQEQQKLRETPGASFYGEKPMTPKKSETLTEKPSTTGTAGGDNIPLEVGTRRRGKKSGRVQIWNGSEWVDE